MKTFREELRRQMPKTYERRDRGSRAAAIKLQCLECVGGVRKDITACTDAGCPLYLVRPFRTHA